jgi:alpha-beta hydrolase superfamily lysophospholipase
LYLKDKNAPFALQFHGYKSTPMLDFSGGGLLAMELGFNVIMPDERACGESEGNTISFGYNEHRDVYTWIDYIKKNFGEDVKIILFGVSLGAGTVIMSAGRGVSENVKGVLADCPFSSTREIVTKVIYDMNLPGRLLYPLVRIGAKIYGGFDPDMAAPVSDAKGTKVPILIVHGEADFFVPMEMSKKIAASSKMISLHTFPDAKHGTSFITDRERYTKLAKDFINECLQEEKIKI